MNRPSMLGAALAAVVLLAAAAPAQAAKLFAVSSSGEPSTGEIYRYEIRGPTDPGTLDLTIDLHAHYPQPAGAPGLYTSPVAVAFSRTGELFVMDRGWGGAGSYYGDPSGGRFHRFLRAQAPSPAFNGTVEAGDVGGPEGFRFRTPHWADFRGNELFVAERHDGVDRFVVSPDGTLAYNGNITNWVLAGDAPRGVKVAPWGEVFVSVYWQPELYRFLLAPDGTAIPNGTVSTGVYGTHDLAFSAQGELFVTAAGACSVLRFKFVDGEPVPSGSIPVAASSCGNIGLAIAPWGELFVAEHNAPLISRFLLRSDGAVANGTITTPYGVGGIGDVEFFEGR